MSLPGDAFQYVEGLVKTIKVQRYEKKTVTRDEILAPAQRFPQTGQFDMDIPYVSLDPESFGQIGFVVGYCDMNRQAAFVQTKELRGACRFGDLLARPVGVIVTMDWLVPLAFQDD
jgi:hypothetical protein